jgi:hypothetical protein
MIIYITHVYVGKKYGFGRTEDGRCVFFHTSALCPALAGVIKARMREHVVFAEANVRQEPRGLSASWLSETLVRFSLARPVLYLD